MWKSTQLPAQSLAKPTSLIVTVHSNFSTRRRRRLSPYEYACWVTPRPHQTRRSFLIIDPPCEIQRMRDVSHGSRAPKFSVWWGWFTIPTLIHVSEVVWHRFQVAKTTSCLREVWSNINHLGGGFVSRKWNLWLIWKKVRISRLFLFTIC